MSMHCKYAVVLFIESRSTAIVHRSWMEKRGVSIISVDILNISAYRLSLFAVG